MLTLAFAHRRCGCLCSTLERFEHRVGFNSLSDPVLQGPGRRLQRHVITNPAKRLGNRAPDNLGQRLAADLHLVARFYFLRKQKVYPRLHIQLVGDLGHLPVEHATDAVQVFLGGPALRLHQGQLVVCRQRYEVALGQVDRGLRQGILRLKPLLGLYALGLLVTLPSRLVVQILGQAERIGFGVVDVALEFALSQNAAGVGIGRHLGQQPTQRSTLLLTGGARPCVGRQHPRVFQARLPVQSGQV